MVTVPILAVPILASPWGQAFQETDERLAYEPRTLLLDEMSGTVDEQCSSQSGNRVGQRLNGGGARSQRYDGVLAAGDEQGRLVD